MQRTMTEAQYVPRQLAFKGKFVESGLTFRWFDAVVVGGFLVAITADCAALRRSGNGSNGEDIGHGDSINRSVQGFTSLSITACAR